MNSRERVLLGVLFSLLIVLGGGALFYFLFYKDYLELSAQVAGDQQRLLEKRTALKQAEAERDDILKRDPRLKDWQKLSLPELPSKPGGGKHTEVETKAHLTEMSRLYQRNLGQLLEKNGFTSIQIQAKNPDTKTVDTKGGAPTKDKVPIYTRLPFTVTGTAKYASIIDMLKQFHNEPLLQEVRSLSITKPQTPRQDTPGRDSRDVLDVSMTIEVLMVTGADTRSGLMPDIKPGDEQVLAYNPTTGKPSRDYNEMLKKDPFHGKPTGPQFLSEGDIPKSVVANVLSFVKLTTIFESNTDADHERWGRIATFYNQGRGGPEMRVHMPAVFAELKVPDDSGKTIIFTAKLVYIDATQVVLEEKGKYYLVHVGDFIQTAIERQELRRPDELKKFNLTPGKVASTKEAE